MKGRTAFGVGLLIGGTVAGVLGLQKARRLQERALLVQTGLLTRGNDLELYLASQGDELRSELREVAEVKGGSLARATAQRVISDDYGLSPSVIRQLQRLDMTYRVLRDAGYV